MLEPRSPRGSGDSQLLELTQCCNLLVASELLARLAPRDLAAAACSSRRLNALVSDQLWGAALEARLPRLVRLLEASPQPPEWWAGRTWRQRTAALAAGATFSAQVYNRELENVHEDFLLSCYDATCSLAPASAAALLSGSAGAGAALAFSARYLPMGAMPAVVEADVAPERLRLCPAGSSPLEVYSGGVTAASAGLCVGEEVEVQWKGRRGHPFGWWFGTVQSARGNRITLVFRQYPRSSAWHRVKAPLKAGREAVVNGDFTFGYVGGLRRLTAEEREEWRRHGAPCPPAPGQLAALEAAAAEEEWSDEDDDLDIDIDLAAELEAELEGALLEIGEIVAAAEDEAGQAAAGEAAAGAAAEAAPGPAAPPGQPIAMQLGQAPGGPGLPVELAAGGGASGGQLQQAQQQAQGADP